MSNEERYQTIGRVVDERNTAKRDLGILRAELDRIAKLIIALGDLLKEQQYDQARGMIGGDSDLDTDLSRLKRKLAEFTELSQKVENGDKALKDMGIGL